jgi:hypothetical protein
MSADARSDHERHAEPGRRQQNLRIDFAIVACAAFAFYWASSFILHARGITMHFGADTSGYTEFAHGNVFARMTSTYDLDRIMRFHLTTAMLATGWMAVLAPLTQWIARIYLLKAMFALIAATGVWAAMSAFAVLMPRRQAILFGMIYAVSFSVWYFSSVEESKIVSATLATSYIAIYLHLRKNWSTRGALLLTAILFLACLNEIVAGFLVIIPIVDTLMQRGWDWRRGRWIAAHALVGPLALAILEGFAYLFLTPDQHPEGASHISMLVYYVWRGYQRVDMIYLFVVNWLFFSLAAPTPNAPLWTPPGFFEPVLSNYFSSRFSASLIILLTAAIAVAVVKGKRVEGRERMAGIALGLAIYSLVRATFFFIFDPPEALLFSSSVTLAHLLIVAIAFASIDFPGKPVFLAALPPLLFATNQAFILGL